MLLWTLKWFSHVKKLWFIDYLLITMSSAVWIFRALLSSFLKSGNVGCKLCQPLALWWVMIICSVVFWHCWNGIWFVRKTAPALSRNSCFRTWPWWKRDVKGDDGILGIFQLNVNRSIFSTLYCGYTLFCQESVDVSFIQLSDCKYLCRGW